MAVDLPVPAETETHCNKFVIGCRARRRSSLGCTRSQGSVLWPEKPATTTASCRSWSYCRTALLPSCRWRSPTFWVDPARGLRATRCLVWTELDGCGRSSPSLSPSPGLPVLRRHVHGRSCATALAPTPFVAARRSSRPTAPRRRPSGRVSAIAPSWWRRSARPRRGAGASACCAITPGWSHNRGWRDAATRRLWNRYLAQECK